jgi:hypothetical protein
MSYCVNCGVELSPKERVCPLCGTPVLRPGQSMPPLPEPSVSYSPKPVRVERHSLLVLLTILFLLPILLSFFCDVSLHGSVEWAGYVAAGVILIYVALVLPLTLHTPVLFQLMLNVVALEGVLYYICHSLRGNWYWSFAFPIALFPFATAFLFVLLHRFARWNGLHIAALSCLSCGFYCLLIEWRCNVVFAVSEHFVWSFYPLITAAILAAILFFISRSESLQQRLARRFFI